MTTDDWEHRGLLERSWKRPWQGHLDTTHLDQWMRAGETMGLHGVWRLSLPHVALSARNTYPVLPGMPSTFLFLVNTYLVFFCFFFWPRHVACGILVPWPGIKPGPPAVKARSPNHWTTREVPTYLTLRPCSNMAFLEKPPPAQRQKTSHTYTTVFMPCNCHLLCN